MISLASAGDSEIVGQVADRLGMDLPPECVPGVAFNVRLLERHIDILREGVVPEGKLAE